MPGVSRRQAYELLERLHADSGGRCLTCATWSPCRTKTLLHAMHIEWAIYSRAAGRGSDPTDSEVPGQVDLYELLDDAQVRS